MSSVFKLKAKLFKKIDRPDEAIEALKLYLAHRKSDTEAAQFLSELNASRSEEQAILATPTLAEIYLKQGETGEAIKIYQQLLWNSPDDEKSRSRLGELMSISRGEEPDKIQGTMAIEKKMKLIGILENWLATIEKRKAASL